MGVLETTMNNSPSDTQHRVIIRFMFIYLVILQTQETSAKSKSGRCRIKIR